MGIVPRFSNDFSKLCFIGSQNKFLSHSGNYQLKYLNWPFQKDQGPTTVLDYVNAYPKDDGVFCGLFGYNMTYTESNFISKSNRYYLFESEFMSQGRIYIADLENPGQVKLIDFLKKHQQGKHREGEYVLLKFQDDVAIIKYSSVSEPPKCYAVHIKNADTA